MIFSAQTHRQLGFTLTELMIVLALVSIAIFMTTPYLFGTLEKQRLTAERDKVVFALKQAQQKSRVAQEGMSYGLEFPDKNTYVQQPSTTIIAYKHGIELTSTATSVYFRKLTGNLELTPDASELLLTLRSSSFFTTIYINSYGVLNTTTPQPI